MLQSTNATRKQRPNQRVQPTPLAASKIVAILNTFAKNEVERMRLL